MYYLVVHNLEMVNLLAIVKRNLPLKVIVARIGDWHHPVCGSKDQWLLRLGMAWHLHTLEVCSIFESFFLVQLKVKVMSHRTVWELFCYSPSEGVHVRGLGK